jgi:hypothetical protein
MMEFQKFVIAAKDKSCFQLGQIGNMDEVALTFDIPSNRTQDMKGAEWITIKISGQDKTHYTATLVCCADGTKLPLLLIFK